MHTGTHFTSHQRPLLLPLARYAVLTRSADGDEGGRHHLVTATVSNGNLYILKIQAGDKRWFKVWMGRGGAGREQQHRVPRPVYVHAIPVPGRGALTQSARMSLCRVSPRMPRVWPTASPWPRRCGIVHCGEKKTCITIILPACAQQPLPLNGWHGPGASAVDTDWVCNNNSTEREFPALLHPRGGEGARGDIVAVTSDGIAHRSAR